MKSKRVYDRPTYVPIRLELVLETQYEHDMIHSIMQAMAPLNSTLGSITPEQYEYLWKLVLALRNATINDTEFTVEVSKPKDMG
jgi:hypothetical protein